MGATAVAATVIATLTGVTPMVATAAFDTGRALAHPMSSHHHGAKAVAGRSVPGTLHQVHPVTPSRPSSSSAGSGSSTSVDVAGVKAPITGLLDRHHAPSKAYTSVVRGFVVNVSWASLQPTRGGPIVHPNEIDKAIAEAQASNMALKLRVRAGIDAPEWAKHLDGTPVTFHYSAATAGKSGQVAGTVGRFWTPQFGAAYQDLQNKLAAAYDNVPQVRQTDVTRCQTIFSETYLRDTMNKDNARALVAAGFTRAQDDVCHTQQMQAHLVWKHTRSDVAFNPYTAIAPDGTVKQDMPYTLAQMDYCRQLLGIRCVLENHSLAEGRITNKNYGAIYAKMRAMAGSGAFDFQTATAAKMGDFEKVISWAGSVGASSVELPTGYTGWSMGPMQTMQSKF
jgi:hypothetical protein